MRRGIAPIGLILATGLALLFLLPGSVSSGMASSLSVAATGTTHLAWFYGEPQDGTTAQTLATRNSAWVLSGIKSRTATSPRCVQTG